MSLPDEVRRHAARAAGDARWVRIVAEAVDDLGEPPAEGAPPASAPEEALADEAARATLLLCLATVGFGLGWTPGLRVRPGLDAAQTTTSMLVERFVAHGAWTAGELRALRADELADALGQPRDHELVALQAQALRALGRWLAGRPVLAALHAAAGGSAERLAGALAAEVAMYADPGLAARAQRAAADLARSGVLPLSGAERLTASAGAALPAALRAAGVLVLDPRLAGLVDGGRALRPGAQEHELRTGAVHACELLAARDGLPPRVVAERALARAAAPGAPAARPHRCATIAY